jgi:hypothetical protein
MKYRKEQNDDGTNHRTLSLDSNEVIAGLAAITAAIVLRRHFRRRRR